MADSAEAAANETFESTVSTGSLSYPMQCSALYVDLDAHNAPLFGFWNLNADCLLSSRKNGFVLIKV